MTATKRCGHRAILQRFALHDFEASGTTVILHRTPRRTCAGFTSSDVQGDLELYRMTE
jgi:hypothetical protein